jgi:hypothetical protein
MTPLFVGDIHGRPALVRKAIDLAQGTNARLIFLGDLLDGDSNSTPQDSAECVRLIREHNYECVLGNHELYPIFARNKRELAKWWKSKDDKTSDRIWFEWLAIKAHLSEEDLKWLRNLPLYIQGISWIAVHAQVPLKRFMLPYKKIKGTPTLSQILMTDGTYNEPFWATEYDGRFGHCYFGHTRRVKLNNRYQFPHATLLDWGAKKGGTAGACFLDQEPFALEKA